MAELYWRGEKAVGEIALRHGIVGFEFGEIRSKSFISRMARKSYLVLVLGLVYASHISQDLASEFYTPMMVSYSPTMVHVCSDIYLNNSSVTK